MDNHTNSAEELYALYHKDIVRFFAEHLADREAAWDLCQVRTIRLPLPTLSPTTPHHDTATAPGLSGSQAETGGNG
jgi:hypothetical protein